MSEGDLKRMPTMMTMSGDSGKVIMAKSQAAPISQRVDVVSGTTADDYGEDNEEVVSEWSRSGSAVQAPSSYEATTGDIGIKQQSLIQKCKIFLELLNDPAVHDNKPILSDNAESNIAILSADPPEDANVIAKTLMIKLKECMVQLGDLINLQNQSQIRALGDYLDAAKEVIESLNGPKFEDEKKALDEAQCDPATMSEEVCQAKLKAAIERVNELKTNILKSIQEKKDGLAGFDTRKQNIEEIKVFFETIQFNESLTPEKITELKTKAGELKDKEGQDANEQNILKELISDLENLNRKLGDVGAKKEDLKRLEEETAKLSEELSQVAAQQAQTEAKIAAQQTSMAKTVDTGAQVEETTDVPVEGGETEGDVPVTMRPREEGQRETPTVVKEQGGETPTVVPTGTEREETPTVVEGKGEEPPTVVKGQGGEETPTVVEEEGENQSIDSDQGTDEEVATALEGKELSEQRMQSESGSLTPGDTASTHGRTPPVPIVDEDQPPIKTGDTAGMVKEVREEQIKIVQDQINSLMEEKREWAEGGREGGSFSKDEEIDRLTKKRDDIQGPNPPQTGGKRKKRRRKSRKSQKGGKKKSKKRRSKKNKK